MRTSQRETLASGLLFYWLMNLRKTCAFSFWLAALLGPQLMASKGLCAIPYALRSSIMQKFSFAPSGFDFSQGYDASSVQPVKEDPLLKQADVAKVIPQNMQPTNSQGKVASQVLDRGVNAWMQSDSMQHSSIGRTAKSVESSMKTEQSFGGSDPDAIKHSVKFSVRATESRADLEYTGLTTAQLTYYASGGKTNIEFREPVGLLKTNLVYDSSYAPGETKNLLSMRWGF